ncbi:gliding motility-associated ABC transporter ATP-binding subunit GldA [Haloflavibacter putidus]|uniref:Gliding motility-associated ABC transporter ATP-binding subunit GldA n=1 Tax=Haloflavibacter putidus TaxID=2576776 RepID=A0A507ZYK4_9FLAO|nr:gliding motility-associated ABC transporter ATP-binding subunit GldA [Haloflavibacter putidus]TQD39825.1 gliding motility-associated ABC transporter ATP-binding subunit GldA [Haloflavibacter putidus]
MGIEVNNLSKLYGKQKALNQVSFVVKTGQIVGFLGPNGAGKSTLMKILTGYLPATKGWAKVEDLEVSTQKLALQRKIGYLPEHNPLYLEMYVREYLNFNANIYKVSKKQVEKVIEQTGLLPEANKKIEQLSKGFRQRVGLASALLHDPEVLILDEPTTGLDPNQLVEIRELIKEIGQTKTVFLSTHIMQEVEAVCDRAIIINKGSIVADKQLNQLAESQEQVVVVEFDFRVEMIALQKLPKLEKVVNTGGFRYELYFDTTKDMRPAIFDFAHDNGLKILQLHQKHTSLEDLFRTLTQES